MRGPPAALHGVERHLYRRTVFAFQRGAKLADNAGLAHRLDIVPAQKVALQIQHAPRGVVREPQSSLAVDNEHTFDHARQDGFPSVHDRSRGRSSRRDNCPDSPSSRGLASTSRTRRLGKDSGRSSIPPQSGSHGDNETQEGLEHRLPFLVFRQLVAELLDRDEGLLEKGKLFAEPSHVDVNGARGTWILVVPDIGQQPIAREHAAAMFEKILKQQKFLCCQPHIFAVVGHRMPFEVDVDGAAAQDALLESRGGVARRSSVRTRAVGSFGLNGLTT